MTVCTSLVQHHLQEVSVHTCSSAVRSGTANNHEGCFAGIVASKPAEDGGYRDISENLLEVRIREILSGAGTCGLGSNRKAGLSH